jgi:hypothetical protein
MMQIVGQPGLDIPLTGQLDQFEQLDHPGSGYRGNSLKHIQFLQKLKNQFSTSRPAYPEFFCKYRAEIIQFSLISQRKWSNRDLPARPDFRVTLLR